MPNHSPEQQQNGIPPPPSEELTIWRYMDFTKFVALLEDQALFFARISCLDDPFEGSFPTQQPPLQRLLSLLPQGAIPAGAQLTLSPGSERVWQAMRHWAMVSCWNASPYESAAMWKLHAKSDEAIGIRSNVGRLRRSLKLPEPREGFMGGGKVNIGMVEYIDYNANSIPTGNIIAPFFRKRRSFQHEQELRAIIFELPICKDKWWFDLDREPEDDGRPVTVDIDTLIEGIFVAPQASSWYVELVRKIKRRYGLNASVNQSSLDASPIY